MSATFERADAQRRTVEKLLRGINEDKIATDPSFHAEDFSAYDATLAAACNTPEEMAEFGAAFLKAFEGYRLELDEFFTSGPNGAFTWVWKGTYRPRTGGGAIAFAVPGVSVLEFAQDNRIRKETAYFAIHEFLRQVGLPPFPMESVFRLVGLNVQHAPQQ